VLTFIIIEHAVALAIVGAWVAVRRADSRNRATPPGDDGQVK
jgi:hypothetical protein